ncbi:MAG: hypothetical protein IT385_06570 [Deltaproteobacteria bacterium]|nr:hypothetical protein [Deltaproteobacteria bacterium]
MAPRRATSRWWIAALATALAQAGCGPSPWQAGTSVLLATPIAALVGHLLLLALVHLWRGRQPVLTTSWRTSVAVGGLALAGGVTLAVTGDEPLRDWPAVAIVTFGSSYLAILLLAFRVALALRPARASMIAIVVAAVLTVAPAPLAIARAGDPELWYGLWIWPGVYGAPTGILLVALLVEGALRGGARPKAG